MWFNSPKFRNNSKLVISPSSLTEVIAPIDANVLRLLFIKIGLGGLINSFKNPFKSFIFLMYSSF